MNKLEQVRTKSVTIGTLCILLDEFAAHYKRIDLGNIIRVANLFGCVKTNANGNLLISVSFVFSILGITEFGIRTIWKIQEVSRKYLFVVPGQSETSQQYRDYINGIIWGYNAELHCLPLVTKQFSA